MIIYCGCPTSAPFNDRFSYIVRAMPRETIVEICSMWDTLVTMTITRTGSVASFIRCSVGDIADAEAGGTLRAVKEYSRPSTEGAKEVVVLVRWIPSHQLRSKRA